MDAPALTSCEVKARVLRRNWVVPMIAGALALVGVAYEHLAHPAGPLGYFVTFLALVFAALALTRNAFPRSRLATILASRTALVVGTDSAIPAAEIAEAKIIPARNGEATVLLTIQGRGSLALRMPQQEAAKMLGVLGISAGERRTTFALVLPLRTRFLWPLLVLGIPWLLFVAASSPNPVAAALVSLVVSVVPGCLILAMVAGLLRGRLVIGADGFSVRWFGRERFFAFADVTAAEEVQSFLAFNAYTPADTMVELRSGRTIRLRAPNAPVTQSEGGAEARALYDHFAKSLERARRRPVEVQNVAALLAVGSRSSTAWLAHLDELVHGGGARYRVAAPSPDLLAAIAGDASSPADTRIGAATALARLDDEGRKAVRIAADACAEPKLRASLVSLSEAHSDQEFTELLSEAARTRR